MKKKYSYTEKKEIESKIVLSNFQKQSFKEQINQYLKNQMNEYETFYLGLTPKIIMQNGTANYKLKKKKKTIKKILNFTDEAHNIGIDLLTKIPKLMIEPLIILKGNEPNTIVLIIELEPPLLIALSINAKENEHEVTRILSIYKKRGIISYLVNHSRDIIDFYDLKKTNLWLITKGLTLTINNTLDDTGLQLPKFPNKDLSYKYIICLKDKKNNKQS